MQQWNGYEDVAVEWMWMSLNLDLEAGEVPEDWKQYGRSSWMNAEVLPRGLKVMRGYQNRRTNKLLLWSST